MDVMSFTLAERDIILATLAAQVNNIHQLVYQWDEDDYGTARALMERLTSTAPGGDPVTTGETAESQAIVRSLFVQLYDLDHPELTPEQWEAAEVLLAAVTR